ncbi:MAG: HEPN domain-containing protein [Peptococcaceae bacterium]|nr:HEPN domain-containing protein [Peptococcaceae bacterium]
MNKGEQLRELGAYWLEKAKDSFQSAQLEYSQGHLSFSINRLYYAVFYVVSAVITSRGLKYGRHSAVRASLHRDFIKTRMASEDMGKLFDRLFYDRNKADYAAFTSFNPEIVKEEIEQVGMFIAQFEDIFNRGQ